jgi:hypothetical protein
MTPNTAGANNINYVFFVIEEMKKKALLCLEFEIEIKVEMIHNDCCELNTK